MQQELVAAREAASERQSSLETTRAAEAELQSALAHARAQLSDERGASMRLARSRRRELLACGATEQSDADDPTGCLAPSVRARLLLTHTNAWRDLLCARQLARRRARRNGLYWCPPPTPPNTPPNPPPNTPPNTHRYSIHPHFPCVSRLVCPHKNCHGGATRDETQC